MEPVLVVTERAYTTERLVHRHAFGQVVLPERGRLDLDVEGRRGAVVGRGFVAVAPGMEHVCWAEAPARCLVVDLAGELIRDAWGEVDAAPFRVMDARLGALTELLRAEAAAGGLVDGLVAESLGRYAALALAGAGHLAGVGYGAGQRALGRKVRAVLDDRFRDDLTLSGVAEAVGASVSHVQRSFRAEAGVSVVEYVQRRRVELAAELLRSTDSSVTEVGITAGFGNPSYFGRVFARMMGVTPSGYRADVTSQGRRRLQS